MRKIYLLLVLATVFSQHRLFAQAVLPDFTLKNNNGEISVLWLNSYPQHVNGISVQRSYDSINNFTSIASVFNPQNTVNGFTDINPPYNKMYYRLFIGFDTGIYILTESKRPEINNNVDYSQLILEINALYEKNIVLQEEKLRKQKEAALILAAKKAKTTSKTRKTVKPVTTKPPVIVIEQDIIDEVITYPSKRIYTDKENNIVMKLPNVKAHKFTVKFFTEDYKPIFTLNNLTDDYFIIEKVNFKYAGWYVFEIYKNDLLFEENKFYIPKDVKKPVVNTKSTKKL